MQPIYQFGGAGQVIHLAIANGFPPQTYAPLVEPLTIHYRVVSLPPRALWPGEPPPDDLHDWRTVAEDMLDGLAQYDLKGVIAVGHSFGGIASILAAAMQPKRFRALVLLDPTILPDSALAAMAHMQADGSIRDFPLAQGALRRKRQWATVEEAYTYFRGKALFHDWSDDVLWLYAKAGTRLSNGGVELVWPPEWEAYYFCTLYTQIWDEVPKLRLPTLLLRGGESDALMVEAAARVCSLIPGATYAEVNRHGHLFPLSAPDETQRIVAEWLAGLA